MNAQRGFKRIILVLAALAMVPGFIVGWIVYENENTRKENIRKEDIFDRLAAEGEVIQKKDIARDEEPELPPGFVLEPSETVDGYRFVDEYRLIIPPPQWQCAIAGAVGAVVSFLVVMLGLGIVLRTSVWIVDGFKGTRD